MNLVLASPLTPIVTPDWIPNLVPVNADASNSSPNLTPIPAVNEASASPLKMSCPQTGHLGLAILPRGVRADKRESRRYESSLLPFIMNLTPAEKPVVIRAVEAYRKAKTKHVGQFYGPTADAILEELAPSPVRWTALASFVISEAEEPSRRKL